MTWAEFLRAHWSVLAAADFFTVEVWGLRGLVTIYVFFVIELATRRIEIAGITPSPNEAWMMQIGRNLTDPIDGFLEEKKFLILDRDSKFSSVFRDLLKDTNIGVVRLPPRSPNLNAYAERFVRSIKDECLNRMIFFGERSLRKATREYAAHYHRERNHQGIANRLIEPDRRADSALSLMAETRSFCRDSRRPTRIPPLPDGLRRSGLRPAGEPVGLPAPRRTRRTSR